MEPLHVGAGFLISDRMFSNVLNTRVTNQISGRDYSK